MAALLTTAGVSAQLARAGKASRSPAVASVPRQPSGRLQPTGRPAALRAAQSTQSGLSLTVTRKHSGRPAARSPRCQAAAAESSSTSGKASTLYLGLLFGLWYAANIFFNIWNKQVLKAYAFPITGTLVQFFIGSLIASAMWLLRVKEAPKVDKDVIIGVLPLAMVHTLGNLLTNLSLSAVSVSFTHTIKAMEPFFSVIMSWLFLGSTPTLPLLATLVPIVAGVALASFSEPSFNWNGFLAAMASNVTFQSRNVLSKKLMGGAKGIKKGSMDNINLFSLITIMSLFLAIPIVLLTEGVRFTPAALSAAGVDVTTVVQRSLLAGLAFHGYQQVSYMILQHVTPVTHSVGNCVKRVVVIVSSVLFFRTPVSAVNAAGTAIALAGVFAYSRVTASKKSE